MLPGTTSGFDSPSLSARSDAAGPAYELKFLVDESLGSAVEAWARQRLILDPHGEPTLDGAYRTTSLYFDTSQLDVYHRAPSYKRRKYRVRRYGVAPWVYFERKVKWGDRVEKRRSALAGEEVAMLAQSMSVESWPGHWFHRRLLMRSLEPASLIAYQRTAYVGACAEGPLRLTLDRKVHGVLTHAWMLGPVEAGLPLFAGQVILELKFRAAMPAPFKELVASRRLRPCAVSKYRLCREAWGVRQDKERGRPGDKETGGQGDAESRDESISLSPCLPVSLSGSPSAPREPADA